MPKTPKLKKEKKKESNSVIFAKYTVAVLQKQNKKKISLHAVIVLVVSAGVLHLSKHARCALSLCHRTWLVFVEAGFITATASDQPL